MPPVREQIDLCAVDVEADDVVADLGEAGCGDEPDVADAEDGDVHRRYGARSARLGCRRGVTAPSSRAVAGKSESRLSQAASRRCLSRLRACQAPEIVDRGIVARRRTAVGRRKDGVGQARDTRRAPRAGPLGATKMRSAQEGFAKAKGTGLAGRFTGILEESDPMKKYAILLAGVLGALTFHSGRRGERRRGEGPRCDRRTTPTAWPRSRPRRTRSRRAGAMRHQERRREEPVQEGRRGHVQEDDGRRRSDA